MIDHDLKPTTLVAHPIFTQPITRVRRLPESLLQLKMLDLCKLLFPLVDGLG